MTSSHPSSPTSLLPQYGFSTDIDFDSLVKTNQFLYRVYTPKHNPPTADDADLFFVAPKFDERFALSPKEVTWQSTDQRPVSQTATYEDIARHMDWTRRSTSSYISTSFSFIWSIWEALRRYHQNVKKDVEIAVIDATLLAGKAATAVQILRKAEPSKRRREYWKWYRFAQESQSVLVHECIPKNAVYTSIPLLQLLEKLPSYFLRPDATPQDPTLSAIAWDYKEKKPSYRQFCQQMSNNFLQASPDVRLRDTTTGSVRLASAFLKPWFHSMVSNNSFERATMTLRDLSHGIAQWPGQWWARDHAEMWGIINNMVASLAEEIRQERRAKARVKRRDTVLYLEKVVRSYQEQIDMEERANSPQSPSDSMQSIFSNNPLEDFPDSFSSVRRRQSLVLTIPWSLGPDGSSPSPSPPESLFSGRHRHFPRHIMGSLADASDLLLSLRSNDQPYPEPRSRTVSMPERPPSPLSETGSFYSPSGPSSPVPTPPELPAAASEASPGSSLALPMLELPPSDPSLLAMEGSSQSSSAETEITAPNSPQPAPEVEVSLPSLEDMEFLTPLVDTSRVGFSLPSKLSPIPESPDAVFPLPLPDPPIVVTLPTHPPIPPHTPLSPTKAPLPDSLNPDTFVILPGDDITHTEHNDHDLHEDFDYTLCQPLETCPSPSPSSTSTLPNTPQGTKLSLSRAASPSKLSHKKTPSGETLVELENHLPALNARILTQIQEREPAVAVILPSHNGTVQMTNIEDVKDAITPHSTSGGLKSRDASFDSQDSIEDLASDASNEDSYKDASYMPFYHYPIRLIPLSLTPTSSSSRAERSQIKVKEKAPEHAGHDGSEGAGNDADRHSLPRRRHPTAAETASCLITGFFIGACITLCILSPQRRTLITNLT